MGAEIANSQERESESDWAKQKMRGKREGLEARCFIGMRERQRACSFSTFVFFFFLSLWKIICTGKAAMLVSLFQAV
jgi:hypothetical protein